MSDLPPPPPRPPRGPSTWTPPASLDYPEWVRDLHDEPRHRRGRWLLLGAAVIVALALAGVLLGDGGEDDGIDHPDRWDPRVVDLAEFVERERGLRFEHPVTVEFLTPEAYTESVTVTDDELDEDERAELEATAGWLRALGLVSGPLDLFAALNEVNDGGTAAFYRPEDERVRVRGTELTVLLRAVLVHELTHALQDQHFDVEGLIASDDSSGSSTAGRALVEGDALRIEQAFVAQLSPADQALHAEQEAALAAASEAATEDLPGVLRVAQAAPYVFGRAFVTMLDLDGGNDEVNDAFERPPTTEEHLLDPTSYLLDEGADTPDLELEAAGIADEDVVDEDTFGAVFLYLVLAERIDPKVALDAALGWAGDAYAAYREDDRTCMRAVFRGDESRDEVQISDALGAWAALVPGGGVRTLAVDGHPGFEACDPGEGADLAVPDRSLDTILLPARYASLGGELAGTLGAAPARCVARATALAAPYERFAARDASYFSTGDFERVARDAVSACGSGDR